MFLLLEEAEPRLREHGIGEIALREDLDARLVTAQLGEERVLRGSREARVEHLDDHVL